MTLQSHLIQEFDLPVSGGHTVHVYDWGNPDATTPFIFLHGGPGGQIKDKHTGSFDPAVQRVVFFDQRGGGRSTPYGSLEQNTTQEMVKDISAIADHLGIQQFYLHGSSWGSTLSLAYALEHPERVKALLIGGVWTSSSSENHWLDQGEFRTFYPDVWDAYLARTPAEHHNNPSAYHFDKALHGIPVEQKASAYAYDCLESGVVKLDDRSTPAEFDTYDPAGIRIEIQYIQNLAFLPDRYILDNAARLTMPVHIVQGRYDMVCPPITAYELSKKLPNCKLYWTISGHAHEHENQNVFKAIIAGLRDE